MGGGFFGCCYNATIKNLTVEGSVSGSDSSTYIGGICGHAGLGDENGSITISNCTNNASISGYNYVGGICGAIINGCNGEIKNCTNNGNIIGKYNTDEARYNFLVGGICGQNGAGAYGCDVTNCVNNGDVTNSYFTSTNEYTSDSHNIMAYKKISDSYDVTGYANHQWHQTTAGCCGISYFTTNENITVTWGEPKFTSDGKLLKLTITAINSQNSEAKAFVGLYADTAFSGTDISTNTVSNNVLRMTEYGSTLFAFSDDNDFVIKNTDFDVDIPQCIPDGISEITKTPVEIQCCDTKCSSSFIAYYADNDTELTFEAGATKTFTMYVGVAAEDEVNSVVNKVLGACYIDTDTNGSFNGNEVKYPSITAALEAAMPNTEASEKPTVIRMIANSTENITIADNRYITLDLNGYVLKGTGSNSVIENNGTLTIDDSNANNNKAYFTYNSDAAWGYIDSPTSDQKSDAVAFEDMGSETLTPGTTIIEVTGGCITGGSVSDSENNRGGGIYNSGELTIEDGNIIGNSVVSQPSKSAVGGGVFTEGTLTMTGGSVSGNTVSGDTGNGYDNVGAGLVVYSGTATISGGCISYNIASGDTDDHNCSGFGAGICNAANLTVNGTAIIENNSVIHGDGGGIGNLDKMTLGGTAMICNNTATYGGGITNYGTLNISDSASISQNYATAATGGVENSEDAIVNMTGGSISDNSTSGDCGGVYNNDATFNMSGGSITGNSSNSQYPSGGLYSSDGTITLKGDAMISGNTTTYNEKTFQANLCLSGKTETDKVTLDNLTSGALIGVTTMVNNVVTSGQFTTNGTADDIKSFFSDNASYTVAYNAGNDSTPYLELITTDNISTDVSGAGYYASLTLNDNIDVNFKMKNLASGVDNEKLSIYVDGTAIEKNKITIATDTDSTEKKMATCVLKAVAPKNMGDDIHVVVAYDGVIVKTFDYSVQAYCQTVLADSAGSYSAYNNLKALCKATLNYGKWAEDYYNEKYTTGAAASTVNNVCVITYGDNVFQGYTTKEFLTKGESVTDASASLTLDSNITLNFKVKTAEKVTLSNENITITNDLDNSVDAGNIEVVPLTGDTNGYTYKISVTGIGASQLYRTYTLTASCDTVFEITYGVYDYCYSVQSMNVNTYPEFTDTLKTLCKAIYTYGEAAKTYSENPEG